MYPTNIKSVHIELTDKCQAACPMCARNYSGGEVRPFIKNSEISIEQFEKWFSPKFLSGLDALYTCGNYGDPAFAKDCLEIYEYARRCNPTMRLAIHTNGSLRKPNWWAQLAKSMGPNSEVIFAIDGFKGKHELYRRNTSFDKIIENMTAYIQAGGCARVDSLVFAHNEDDVEELEKYLLSLGVTAVNFKSTTRFYNMDKFPVVDNDNNYEYDLYPAQRIEFYKKPNAPLESFLDGDFLQNFIDTADINPRCVSKQEIYVDPHGNVLPCCYLGSDYLEIPLEERMVLHTLRNLTVENTKRMLEHITVPNLNYGNVETVLTADTWKDIASYWEGKNKCLTCIKNCSNSVYS
jgi:MoaA/NifB/PqqE/SkfB family radical SAM enzyme